MKISEGLLKKMEAPSNKIGELLLAHTNLTEGQLNKLCRFKKILVA